MNEELRGVLGTAPYEDEGIFLSEEKEGFVIDSDEKAEWALEKIRDAREEKDRLLALIASKRKELSEKEQAIENRCARETDYLIYLLSQYMATVKAKETKTQASYQLLSGKLIRKKPSVAYDVNEDALAGWLQERGYQDLLQVKPRWGDVKKLLAGDPESGAVLLDGTGELVEGVTAIQKPEEFRVQV